MEKPRGDEKVSIERPFVVEQEILFGQDKIQFTLGHAGQGYVYLSSKWCNEEESDLCFNLDTAVKLRDALDALIEEQARKHVNVSLSSL